MRIVIGSDDATDLTAAIVRYLRDNGHDLELIGALAPSDEKGWPHVGYEVARRVVAGQADTGVVLCWTGTGVAIAANKVKGAAAALCLDAETARGARLWDDANVLALSLRMTSIPIAKEVLDVWLGPLRGERDAEDQRCLGLMRAIEDKALGGAC